jgi:Arc/MetJ-type ribon-helix-helix transcriptional regulator
MTIHLPPEIERSIQAAVHSGHFASVDDAMTKAASMLLERLKQEQPQANPTSTGESPDPLLGIWRDAPEEIDEIVAEAMQNRQTDAWRAIPGE